jgi:hypothetical protein
MSNITLVFNVLLDAFSNILEMFNNRILIVFEYTTSFIFLMQKKKHYIALIHFYMFDEVSFLKVITHQTGLFPNQSGERGLCPCQSPAGMSQGRRRRKPC